MTYLVLDDDPAGSLLIRKGTPTIDLIEELLRGRGWNRVYPARQYRMCGWASDVGLISRDVFNRNIIGSCLLVALGAPAQPYAGPIVLTGYAFNETGLAEQLPEETLRIIDTVYRAVRRALEFEPYAGVNLADGGPADPAPEWDHDQWRESLRAFAAQVRDDPAPGMTFQSVQ